MPIPSTEQFMLVAGEILDQTNFPNCAGCLYSKIIKIKDSTNLPCTINNSTKNPFIVLQALIDFNFRFMHIDVGGCGEKFDGLFVKSSLYENIQKLKVILPKEVYLPNNPYVSAPFVFLGSNSFPLKTFLLTPYKRTRNSQERFFNNKLAEIREITDLTFQILLSKFPILSDVLDMNARKASVLVKCLCLLQNLIIDMEGINDKVIGNASLINYQPLIPHKTTTKYELHIRDIFKDYFLSQHKKKK